MLQYSQDYGDKRFSIVSLSKLNESYGIIESNWQNDKIIIRILVFKNSASLPKGYEGYVDYADVRKSAARFEKDFDEFKDEIKEAICAENGLPNFTYTIDSEDNFLLKKEIENLKVLYFECGLDQTNSLVYDILMEAITKQNTSRQEVEAMKAEVLKIKNEMNNLIESNREMVEQQKAYEEKLIANCRQVTNSKKRKISQLEAALGEDAEEFVSSQKSIKKSYSHLSQLSGEKDEKEEINFEEEKESDKSSDEEDLAFTLPKRPKIDVIQPSTSKLEMEEKKPPESDPFEKDTQALLDEEQTIA